jgi:hypothetical protein
MGVRRKAVFLTSAAIVCALLIGANCGAQTMRLSEENGKHCKWLSERLQEVRSVRPGMTEAQLLKVFYPDGGIQHFQPQVFVLRSCYMIKVDVTFDLPEGFSRENLPPPNDVRIKSISKPYLEYPHAD